MKDFTGKTAIVIGASRGLGHAITMGFAEAGATVVAVSRGEATFPKPVKGCGRIHPIRADAAEPGLAAALVDQFEPNVVVIVAGAVPHMVPLSAQTWETFSLHWDSDVRIAFEWLRESLIKPLQPGSRVIVFSSGAALKGSPLSGGYAGAKATQRLITGYAQDEARRAGLDITFTSLLPRFSPETGVGERAVKAYADRYGLTPETYLNQFHRPTGPLVTPEGAATCVLDLADIPASDIASSYLLTGAGLQPLP